MESLGLLEISWMVLGVLVGGALGFLVARIFFLVKLQKHRRAAVAKSRQVVTGQVSEQIAPLLPNFPFEPKDLMFLGKGVDYLVLDGLSRGALEKIVFLEVKTGKSQLNRNEKMIRDAVGRGAVEYAVWRM